MPSMPTAPSIETRPAARPSSSPAAVRGATRGFIALIGAAMLLFAGASLAVDPGAVRPGAFDWISTIGLGAAALVAARFPIHLTHQTKVYLDTAVFTAMAIHLGVPESIAIAAGSVAIVQSIVGASRVQIAFNAAQTGLYVGAGTLTFHTLSRSLDLPFAAAVAGAALVMLLLNTLLISTVGALEADADPIRVWRADIFLDLPEHLALVLIGVAAALAVDGRPWLLPLIIAPAFAIYWSLRRIPAAHLRSRSAAEDIARAVDDRSPGTIGHSDRVAARVAAMGRELGLPANQIARHEAAARVHDLGDATRAPFAPTDEPARDADAGARLLDALPYYASMVPAIRHQCERWDGSGEPDRLAGTEIPIGARLIAVADAFDALTHPGADHPALGPFAALSEMRRQAGTAWDPAIVRALAASLRADASVADRPVAGRETAPAPGSTLARVSGDG